MSSAHLTEEQLIEAFGFLDELRESGATNMFGAPKYVQEDLGWNHGDAKAVTTLWMRTFSSAPVAERVAKVVAA